VNERLLLVEDDPSIREIAAIGLSGSGYRVTSATDGREALDRIRAEAFDAVILDVMLPSLDGFELCREVRRFSRVPILMLTARADTVDVVVGLESGADDYVTKPFEMAELTARVRALLRRAAALPGTSVLRLGRVEIDPAAFTARKDGGELPLTATEFRLLLELARRPGQVFTRELLLHRVWDYDYLADAQVHVYKIINCDFGRAFRGWCDGRSGFRRTEKLRLTRLLLHFEIFHFDDRARIQARKDGGHRADFLTGRQFAPVQVRECDRFNGGRHA